MSKALDKSKTPAKKFMLSTAFSILLMRPINACEVECFSRNPNWLLDKILFSVSYLEMWLYAIFSKIFEALNTGTTLSIFSLDEKIPEGKHKLIICNNSSQIKSKDLVMVGKLFSPSLQSFKFFTTLASWFFSTGSKCCREEDKSTLFL